MQKKERISLYKALGLVGILLLTALILFLNRRPADLSYNPLERALSLYEQGNYQQATIYFAQADVMNVPEAAFALGAMNFAGKGMPVDIPKALAYYEKAAEAGYAPAQMTLALLYIHGENVVQDSDKGLKFAEEAADNGDPEAQIMLARWYENGENVEKDMKKAVVFYQQAALQGDINAKTALSIIYKNGAGTVLPNPYTAARWQESIQKQKRFENIFQNLPPDYIEKAK